VRPAFETTRGLAAFVALVAALLALPLVLDRTAHPRSAAMIETTSENAGHFAFIADQLYRTSGDIDVLFLGSSYLSASIDTEHVKTRLSAALGRPANVIMFAVNWRDEHVYLLLANELLARRRVKMIVMDMPKDVMTGETHPYSYQFLTYADFMAEPPDEEPETERARFAETVLGGPRLLWRTLRPARKSERVASDIGSGLVKQGMDEEFVPVDTSGARELATDDVTYSERTAARFQFLGKPLVSAQLEPLTALRDRIAAQKIPLVIVHTPTYSERKNLRATERLFWPDFFGKGITMIGVPEAELFADYDDKSLRRLFYNEHMNENGGRLFTRAITPALVSAYEQVAATP
jgi:hypothetical protein